MAEVPWRYLWAYLGSGHDRVCLAALMHACHPKSQTLPFTNQWWEWHCDVIACLHLGDLGPVLPPEQGFLVAFCHMQSRRVGFGVFFFSLGTDTALTVVQDFICTVLWGSCDSLVTRFLLQSPGTDGLPEAVLGWLRSLGYLGADRRFEFGSSLLLRKWTERLTG